MNNKLNMFVIEKEINKNVKGKQKQFAALCKILRTTQEYKECISLYDIFIAEIANYLHHLGINTSKQAVIYLDMLLRNGNLSITGENKYHLYKNDKDYLCEIFGARTISGVSVCRHMSALTSDILNLEYYSSWLNAKYINALSDIENNEPYLHAVVGVVCEKGKIIYDPTSSSFASSPKNKEYLVKSQGRIAETFLSFTNFVNPGDYILLNSEQYLINSLNEQELITAWYCPFEETDEEEFKEILSETQKLYQETLPTTDSLIHRLSPTAKRIAELEEKLHPHSDSQILKWCLRQ